MLGWRPSALADYLEVRRDATVKAEPRGDAQVIERVQEGERLQLLNDGQQMNGYYDVLPSLPGQAGWIYRTLVRRYSGEIPTNEEAGSRMDPLDDRTLHLTPEQARYASRHLRLGKPQAVYERVKEGYVVAQDSRRKIPLWVQYELSPAALYGQAERTDNFRADTSIPEGGIDGLFWKRL